MLSSENFQGGTIYRNVVLQLTQSLTNQRTAFESAGYCEDGRVNNDADEYYDNHYFADEKISNGSAEAGEETS